MDLSNLCFYLAGLVSCPIIVVGWLNLVHLSRIDKSSLTDESSSWLDRYIGVPLWYCVNGILYPLGKGALRGE